MLKGREQRLMAARNTHLEVFRKVQAASSDAVDVLVRNLKCGNPAVEVEAARALLSGQELPEAAYSFTGYMGNHTDYTLDLYGKWLFTGGTWTKDPPATLGPGASDYYSADYDGFAFDGEVVYKVRDTPFETNKWFMAWYIPLVGDNDIESATIIPGTQSETQGGRGWHATAWFILKQA